MSDPPWCGPVEAEGVLLEPEDAQAARATAAAAARMTGTDLVNGNLGCVLGLTSVLLLWMLLLRIGVRRRPSADLGAVSRPHQ